MKLSDRITAIPPSATISITARANQMQGEGIDVVNFAAGEPDFDTPQFIKHAAKAALDAGDTKYTPGRGKELLAEISKKLQRENDLQIPPQQIVTTFGAKHAIYGACQVLLDPGDTVLIPSPYWVSYPEMVKLAGGTPVALPTGPQNNFKITPTQLLEAGGSAKVLILNSPCNPTGTTYTRTELAEIAQAVLKTDLIVFSDEIYEKLVYGDTKFTSFASLDEHLPQRTVTFNGLSKTFSMTGWRVGWAAGPKEIIDAIKRLMSHETTNPVSFVQAGALAAYSDPQAPQAVESMRKQFEKRCGHMTERLNAIDGVKCVRPTGAFYCFGDFSSHYGRSIGGVEVTDSASFAQVALAKARVALVPGAPFGDDRYVRLSFATSMEQIDKGLDRLEEMLG